MPFRVAGMARRQTLKVHIVTMMRYTGKTCTSLACRAHVQGQLPVEWGSTAVGA